MKFEIKHRITGAILFELDCGSMRLCIEAAVKSSANLSSANLRYADLRYANLSSANLSSANLSSANLRYANLSYAKNSELAVALTRILPEGEIIGWKKANGTLVKLKIPADAKRSHAFGRKCRAEFAIDIGHWDIKGVALPPEHEALTNAHGPETKYRYGETIRPDSFDDDWTNECSHGVHFFITRLEAEQW